MTISFLMCSERSGSNLITKMLDAHSAICGPATKHLINPVARNLYRYEPISASTNWQQLLQDSTQLLQAPFSVWQNEFSYVELLQAVPDGDIVALINYIFYKEAQSHNKKHVFIKENHLYELMGFLLLNFPDAKYLYQVRDPRDMALSWKLHVGHPGGVIHAARQWQKDQQNYLKNFSELKKRGRAILVRYEDLISSPKIELQRVMALFNLPFENSMLDFHQNDLTQKNAAQQPAWENLSKGLLNNNKNKYLSGLSTQEIIAIEKICCSEMLFLGYELESSDNDRKHISDLQLDELARLEKLEHQQNRPVGAEANTNAKKAFYQHQPNFSNLDWMKNNDVSNP